MNLVPKSARHLEMTHARQMRVDTRDLAEAEIITSVEFLKIGQVKSDLVLLCHI